MKRFGAVFVSRETSKQNEQKMGMHFSIENNIKEAKILSLTIFFGFDELNCLLSLKFYGNHANLIHCAYNLQINMLFLF